MTHDSAYRSGTPCWVETIQPDTEAAQRFYGALLGWCFEDETARLDGLAVAGLSQAPPGSPAVWAMFVAVDDREEATRELAGVEA